MPIRPDMQPVDYLAILSRRKWVSIFVVLSILFGTVLFYALAPEKYKSSTMILVVPKRVPEGYVQSTVSSRVEDRLATIRQQVLSRTRLVAVMDELRLYEKERRKHPLEDVVEMMRKDIDIEVPRNDAFSLSFEHQNAQTAMLATSRLASFFIDENLKTREQQAVGTSEFLDSQLQDVKTRLEEAEEKVRNYKMRYMGELPQQVQANLQVMSGLQEQLRANAESINTAEQRKVFLETQISSLEAQIREAAAPPPVVAPPAEEGGEPAPVAPPPPIYSADPAQPQVNELSIRRARLADLSARYTERYPEIVRLKTEIAQLEARISEIRRQAVPEPVPVAQPHTKSPARPQPAPVFVPAMAREREEVRQMKGQVAALAMDIATQKRERQSLLKSMSAMEAKVAQSPRREQEMIGLSRDYENLKESYDDLLKKKLQADISQNLEKKQKGEQFQILDPANLPEEPFYPNWRKVIPLAMAMALFLGVGSAIGLEAVDPTLHGKSAFRVTFPSLPIMASIPFLADEAALKRKRLRGRLIRFGIVLIVLVLSLALVLLRGRIRAFLGGL